MEALATNPCAACTIDQDCCNHLCGLRLTQIEFDRCFRHHDDDIVVERDGPLYIVSQRDGNACPNWQDGGCKVYDQRPRECALFPHTLYVQQRGDAISVRVHSDTRCPLKAELISSEQVAERLARELAEEAFGQNAHIQVRHETTWQLLWRRSRNLISRIMDTVLS